MKNLKQLVPEDNLTISRSTTKSSTAEREYTEPIPVDLLIDIFSRAPSSKYVARFRCLSKSWASILSRPYFTELFLTKSSHRPRLLFTTSRNGNLWFFSTPQTPNSSVVATFYKTHSSHQEVTSSLLHGLVCCKEGRTYHSERVTLCNPATGEVLTLSEPNPRFKWPVIYCGYDPTEKKFKLLCIAAYYTTNQAWVLTLETGKLLWRKIEFKYHRITSFCSINNRHMICINGVLYFACMDTRMLMETEIVCFDVKSEKFSVINIDNESILGGSSLINYKGRLGVVQFVDINQRILRLWLLEEDANTWLINIYELPLLWKHPCTEHFQIVGMTRTCDIILSPRNFSDPFYVFYYNVEKKALARSEIHGLEELKCHRSPVAIFQDYVEDLKLMKSLY